MPHGLKLQYRWRCHGLFICSGRSVACLFEGWAVLPPVEVLPPLEVLQPPLELLAGLRPPLEVLPVCDLVGGNACGVWGVGC